MNELQREARQKLFSYAVAALSNFFWDSLRISRELSIMGRLASPIGPLLCVGERVRTHSDTGRSHKLSCKARVLERRLLRRFLQPGRRELGPQRNWGLEDATAMPRCSVHEQRAERHGRRRSYPSLVRGPLLPGTGHVKA